MLLSLVLALVEYHKPMYQGEESAAIFPVKIQLEYFWIEV